MKKLHKVYSKGAPIINHSEIEYLEKSVVGLVIDMKSKFCEIDCITQDDKGVPGVHIVASEVSDFLNKKYEKDTPICIKFPQYKGWRVYTTNAGRYHFKIVLVKL